ncbi:hypothetical protein [Streptomyces canus]|uniref:hypothetical protein n=1 Tax=Streptomyces canus TaxID=58343 RepID=UPI00037C8AA8|nr:hypothetical protein [Streptomyces canus]
MYSLVRQVGNHRRAGEEAERGDGPHEGVGVGAAEGPAADMGRLPHAADLVSSALGPLTAAQR